MNEFLHKAAIGTGVAAVLAGLSGEILVAIVGLAIGYGFYSLAGNFEEGK